MMKMRKKMSKEYKENAKKGVNFGKKLIQISIFGNNKYNIVIDGQTTDFNKFVEIIVQKVIDPVVKEAGKELEATIKSKWSDIVIVNIAKAMNEIAKQQWQESEDKNLININSQDVIEKAQRESEKALEEFEARGNGNQIINDINKYIKSIEKENAAQTKELNNYRKSTAKKKESEVINWLVLIGFVLSIIGMILFVVLTDKLPIKKFLMAGGILSGVVFMLVIGITRNKDPKVQNGESDENFNRED